MTPRAKSIRIGPKKIQPKINKRIIDPAKMRIAVLTRDNYTCQNCFNPYPEYHLENDHIVPLHLGGEDSITNCQTLCIPCHRIKSERENNERITKA